MNRTENVKRFISLAIVTLILIGSIAAISSVIHDFSYFPSESGSGKPDSEGSGTFESEDETREDQRVPEGNEETKGEGAGPPGGESKGTGACPTSSDKISPEGGKPPHIPLFYMNGAANTCYLKAIVGVTYDGEMWELGEEPRHVYNGEPIEHKVKNYQSNVKDEIEIKPIEKFPPGFIPVSTYTDKVSLLDSLVYYPEQNLFYSPRAFLSPYSFTTTHYHFQKSTLETSEVIDNEKYLQLPTQITGRTNQLAREIAEGYESPYKKAKAIENYLKTNYEYELDYKRAPEGWEPNDWFLFEEKRGVCANFNSAFVVLARLAGIPSRVVSGYGVNSTSGTQTVFADQAHCWAEIGLEVGWITFDATGEEKELTPTDTEITSMSDVVIAKGHDFIVEGTVLTESGEKVDGMLIDVFLNDNKEEGGMLCGQNETDDGHFEIKCSISPDVEVGDYHVIAHAIKNNKYGESWSDPAIKVISYTEINLGMPEIAKPGETVKIEGNLVEETGNPVSGEEIRIFVEGEEIARTTTNETGVFFTGHAFPKKGNYTVKAMFNGTAYFLESSTEAYIVITLVSLDIETNNTFIRGENVDLCGKAQLGDSPLANEPLNIKVGEKEVKVKITTDENGAFRYTYHVNQTQELGPLKLKYILPEFKTTKSQEVLVKANTELHASVPATVKPGDTINIGAALRDDLGNPLEGKLITLFIPGITSEITNQTNEEGETSFNISIPEDIKNAEKLVNLHFGGSGFYLPSSRSHPININPGFSWFGLILLTLCLLSVVSFGIYKYKYKYKYKWRKTDKGKDAVETEKSAEGIVKVERAEEDKIRIVFPQIKDNFPNVWGVGEELQISCAIPDEGTSSSRVKMEVRIDRTLAYVCDLDENRQYRFTHTFNEKGEYCITAILADGFEFEKLSGTTRIKIVNYREEIAKLYKSFLELSKKRDFAVQEKTTPREVYEMLVTKFRELKEPADEFIGCFEIARYSMHEIGRKDYERMVIARNELEGRA